MALIFNELQSKLLTPPYSPPATASPVSNFVLKI